MFYGNEGLSNSGIVTNPPILPVAMKSGTVTWSISFEGFPTGTLTYTGVSEEELPLFSVYGSGLQGGNPLNMNLGGIELEVDRFGYAQNSTSQGKAVTYTVTVSLKSPIEKKLNKEIAVFSIVSKSATQVSLSALCSSAGVGYSGPSFYIKIPSDAPSKYSISLSSVLTGVARIRGRYLDYSQGISCPSISSGASWNFTAEETTTVSESSTGQVPGFKNLIVTNDFSAESNSDDQFITDYPLEFDLKEPVVETLVDGDSDASIPPKDSALLKTVDSNSIDGSGPKKTKRTVTLHNGKAMKELIEIYGFKYHAEDIDPEEGTTAAPFWGKIEEFTRTYHYEKTPSISFKVFAKNNSNGIIKLISDPDYAGIFEQSLSGNFTFFPQAKFLTKVEGTGWRYARFLRETNEFLATLDLEDDDPSKDLYKFKKINKKMGVYYQLKILNKTDRENLPFTISWVRWEELPANMKNLAGFQETIDGMVGIVTPDINYVPSVYVFDEIDMVYSFASTLNPNFADDEKRYLVLGEESINRTTRQLRNGGYREKVAEYTAQNDFFDVAENTRFRDVQGELPSSDYIMQEWELKPQSDSLSFVYTPPTIVTTYIATSNAPGDNTGGSTSVEFATKIEEAKNALATDLQIKTLGAGQGKHTVQWYHPSMRPGDFLSVAGTSNGASRITDVSFTLDYKGDNNPFKTTLVTTNGTSVSTGLHLPRSVSISTEEETIPAQKTDPSFEEPPLSVEMVTPTLQLSDIPNLGVTRRNF